MGFSLKKTWIKSDGKWGQDACRNVGERIWGNGKERVKKKWNVSYVYNMSVE